MQDIHSTWKDAIIAKDLERMKVQQNTSPLINLTVEQFELERKASLDHELLDKLVSVPHIMETVKLKWGTVYLDKFLNDLFLDTRDNTRQGFLPEVSAAILALSKANKLFLDRIGIVTEPSRDRWELL